MKISDEQFDEAMAAWKEIKDARKEVYDDGDPEDRVKKTKRRRPNPMLETEEE